MDGVTILQTMPAFTIKEFVIMIIMISFLLLLGLILILKFDDLLIGLTGVAFMTFALLVAAQGINPHPKQYKITVDNTVSYNEFTAKYNIIETDGKIITVEEKDNGKNSD